MACLRTAEVEVETIRRHRSRGQIDRHGDLELARRSQRQLCGHILLRWAMDEGPV